MIPIAPATLPRYHHRTGQMLHAHQIALATLWDTTWTNVVLEAPHGSGKTWSYLLPAIQRGQSLLVIHPANATVTTQMTVVADALALAGQTTRYETIAWSGDSLRDLSTAGVSDPLGTSIASLTGSTPRIILATVDQIFFALTDPDYASAVLDALSTYAALVIDDLSMYRGLDLGRLLLLCVMLQAQTHVRLIFSDAQLAAPTRRLIHELFAPSHITHEAPPAGALLANDRMIAWNIDIDTRTVTNETRLAVVRSMVLEAHASSGICAVFFRSPVDAILLEDQLVDAGVAREDIVRLHGLVGTRWWIPSDHAIVLATSAAEAGHLDITTCIVEAGNGDQLLRRLAQVGRLRSARVTVLQSVQHPPLEQVVPTDGLPLTRERLADAVRVAYGADDVLTWTVSTWQGWLAIITMLPRLATAWKQPRAWFDGLVRTAAQILGASATYQRARLLRERPISNSLAALPTMRVSTPPVRVWDVAEDERGFNGSYDADPYLLMTRAEMLWRTPAGRLCVKGYGRWHHPWVSADVAQLADTYGMLQTTATLTAGRIQFHRTSSGTAMALEALAESGQGHVFVVVPAAIALRAPWPVRSFPLNGEASDARIAFDGDALVISAIYDQMVRQTT